MHDARPADTSKASAWAGHNSFFFLSFFEWKHPVREVSALLFKTVDARTSPFILATTYQPRMVQLNTPVVVAQSRDLLCSLVL